MRILKLAFVHTLRNGLKTYVASQPAREAPLVEIRSLELTNGTNGTILAPELVPQ